MVRRGLVPVLHGEGAMELVREVRSSPLTSHILSGEELESTRTGRS
mgnify:CR=1 FL=1